MLFTSARAAVTLAARRAGQRLRFLLFGAGEVAPVTGEILRRAQPDRESRPHVHVG